MRKHWQLFLTAVTATSFYCCPHLHAQAGSRATTQIITTQTDSDGHKVYESEVVQVPTKRSLQLSRPRALMFWSVTDHRYKPVPSANIRAARSAAAEVNELLRRDSAGTASPVQALSYSRGASFTQQQVDAAIDQAAARHNVDASLVRAVIKVESNFNPNAVSPKGAMGLMQLMPQTARQLNVSNPFDPQQNVDAGVRHLKRLMESYGGDVRLTLAAYNAGAGAVSRSAGVPHFAETQNYVKRISELYYGGNVPRGRATASPFREPVRLQRDARGVLYISNTD
jgi:soluble lytic murein transglycosylase-like protein